MARPGPRNLITDVAGLRVGQADDARLKSGVTAILCDRLNVAAVQVLGGAPGTRETDLLEPHNAVDGVNAIVFSGGSAFGLDAASGVQARLREQGVGVEVRGQHIPIVPSAIIFDLTNGGDKDWGRYPPYRELGYEAAGSASEEFVLGSAGAGAGALVSGLKGGVGSASLVLDNGITVAALAVVNSVGSVTVGENRHFWAAPFEIGREFGGLGLPSRIPPEATEVRLKFREPEAGAATIVAVIATDAVMTKAAAKRLAICAHDGFARAVWPTHTPYDGDLVFALATGAAGKEVEVPALPEFFAAAASTMARAIARGVYSATPAENDYYPCWSQR